MMKRLKEYPLKEWMDSADGCEYCGAKAKVMVTKVDESGDYGSILIEYQHKDEICPDQQGFGEVAYGRTTDFVGWEFSSRVMKIAGKELPTLSHRVNIGPCLNCWKLVVGVPLILWPEDGSVELDFCFPCAEKLGILDQLKERVK